jgi:hypothetical protein
VSWVAVVAGRDHSAPCYIPKVSARTGSAVSNLRHLLLHDPSNTPQLSSGALPSTNHFTHLSISSHAKLQQFGARKDHSGTAGLTNSYVGKRSIRKSSGLLQGRRKFNFVMYVYNYFLLYWGYIVTFTKVLTIYHS